MSEPSYVVAVPLLAIVAIATFTDLRERRVPNALTLGGAVLGVLANGVSLGLVGAVLSLLGWALCLVCFLPLYVGGGTAAGDVKLMAMVGAFLGPMSGFVACACALAAGGSLGLLVLAWRSYVAPHLSSETIATKAIDKMPYAAAIAIGAVAAVLQPPWVTALFQIGAT